MTVLATAPSPSGFETDAFGDPFLFCAQLSA